jgi:GTP-binding protein
VVSEFVTSAAGAEGFPKDGVPELALVGRSNVGKSTLINGLLRQKVARTSAAPGKTRLANFFRVSPENRPPFHLVDLPGYGYARGGDAARETFDQLAAEYFESRKREQSPSVPFFAVLLLVDSRHPGLEADWRAWAWLERQDVTRHVVATKLDKLTRAERQRHLAELERRYSGPVTAVSAQTGEGLDALWTTITRLLTRP